MKRRRSGGLYDANSIAPSTALSENMSEKGSDPLEAIRFHWLFLLAREGQTPFRTGSELLFGDALQIEFVEPQVFVGNIELNTLENAA